MEVIEDFELNFALGNVVKYVLRHKGKGGLVDLHKAFWYLKREIDRQELYNRSQRLMPTQIEEN